MDLAELKVGEVAVVELEDWGKYEVECEGTRYTFRMSEPKSPSVTQLGEYMYRLYGDFEHLGLDNRYSDGKIISYLLMTSGQGPVTASRR